MKLENINDFISKNFPQIVEFENNHETSMVNILKMKDRKNYFVTLTSGGIKKQGQLQENGFYKSKKGAENSYLRHLKYYLETQVLPTGKHKLEWRNKPSLTIAGRFVSTDRPLYKVISRLAIF